MKKLNTKNKIIATYIFCLFIIFTPGFITEFSGERLFILKLGIFVLGNICGMGLQKVFKT